MYNVYMKVLCKYLKTSENKVWEFRSIVISFINLIH